MYNQQILYNMMVGIYKITNPKGKVYIGKTTNWPNRKYYYLKCWPWIKEQRKLYNSIVKYGIKNHKLELFYPTTEDELDEKEIYFITYYNAVTEGLNIKHGGQGGRLTQETKDRISQALMGNKQSKETIKRRSESLKGQKRSEYTKKLMSKSKEGFKITWGDKISEAKKQNPFIITEEHKESLRKMRSIPITQHNTDGTFIKEFPSAKEAQKQTGVSNGNICQCLKGKSKTAGGFKWKYKKLTK